MDQPDSMGSDSKKKAASEKTATPPSVRPAQQKGHSTSLNNEIEQLKADRQSIIDLRESLGEHNAAKQDDNADRVAGLRRQLEELLTKLATGPEKNPENDVPTEETVKSAKPLDSSRQRKAASNGPPEENESATPSAFVSEQVLDPVALAQSLYRLGEYKNALQSYGLVDLKRLKEEDRLLVQYMMATCHRKLENTKEAAVLYREVTNSKRDEQLADFARWHLNALRWKEEFATHIQQLRQRQQSLEGAP